MSLIKLYVQTISNINDKIGELLSFVLFGIFALLLLEVFLRYLFDSPTVWANEMSHMLFGVYAVLTGGHILRLKGHVNVDIVYSRFSEKTRAKLDIVTSILFFMFVGMLLVYGGSMALDSISRFEHSGSAWNPPLWPVRFMIPLSALLLILQGIAKLLQDILLLFDIKLEIEEPADFMKGESL